MASQRFTDQATQPARELAETSLAQARNAVEEYISVARSSLSSAARSAEAAQEGARGLNTKAMNFAEANVAAGFEFAEKLIRASDPSEILSVQQDFLRRQMQSLTEQMRELTEAATETARKATQPPRGR